MSSVIYYFTGTGNSYWVAKEVAKGLKDTKLIPIQSVVSEATIKVKAEFVGIIAPVYFNSLPEMVDRFLKKVAISPSTYVYSIITLGSSSSNTLKDMSSILNNHLDYGRHLIMPGNYIRLYAIKSKDENDLILHKAKIQLNSMIKDIQNKKELPYEKDNLIKGFIFEHLARKPWLKRLPSFGKSFQVEAGCNSCKVCQKVCPANNIQVQADGPQWHDQCQDCMACIHACPEQVIQIKDKTQTRGRYIHPEVSIKELTAD